MVHLLPHERYDRYTEAVRRVTAMADCLKDHSLCKNFKQCLLGRLRRFPLLLIVCLSRSLVKKISLVVNLKLIR